MLNVSDNVKNAYNSDSSLKSLKVVFPALNLTFQDSSIIEESFVLKESILEGNDLEFVGCISSYMSVQIYGLDNDVKGKLVQVSIIDHDTETELPLFNGYVDSAKKNGYEGTKTIECYDVLYSLNEIDITSWYNNHQETTLQVVLEELATLCSVSLSSSLDLPNGGITALCGTYKKVSQLSALKLLRYICQINGGFGRINRYGKFELVYLNEPNGKLKYPSVKLYPWHSSNLYPNIPGEIPQTVTVDLVFPFYEKVEFEEFNVRPIDKVIIRDNESEEGVFYGTGNNKYIIQGNIFAFGQTNTVLQNIGKLILTKTQGISFTPFESNNYGLPFIECGDNVYFKDLENNEEIRRSFFIFKRQMKGIQCLNDSYSAEGKKNQSEFITDLGSQIESVRDEQQSQKESTTSDIDELRRRIARLEAIVGGFRTVTGLMIDRPVIENTDTEVVMSQTIASIGEEDE